MEESKRRCNRRCVADEDFGDLGDLPANMGGPVDLGDIGDFMPLVGGALGYQENLSEHGPPFGVP
jgi:hypothetical protein